MSSSSVGKHAGGVSSGQPTVPEPSFAERARTFAGIEAQEAEMTSVDRLGFHLRLKTQDGVKGTRVAFSRVVCEAAETREVFIEMVRQARQSH